MPSTFLRPVARCRVRGHRLEVCSNSCGGYNLGVDGWLVGIADDVDDVIRQLAETLRMRDTLRPAPKLPQRFRDAVAGLE